MYSSVKSVFLSGVTLSEVALFALTGVEGGELAGATLFDLLKGNGCLLVACLMALSCLNRFLCFFFSHAALSTEKSLLAG